jgi:hypothetical protein
VGELLARTAGGSAVHELLRLSCGAGRLNLARPCRSCWHVTVPVVRVHELLRWPRVTRPEMGYAAARYTVENMVKRGDLVEVGRVVMPGTSRQVGVFGPAPAVGEHVGPAGADALALALKAWPRSA